MIKLNQNTAACQAERLKIKTQEQQLKHLAMHGAGISQWEAQSLLEVVNEVFFSEPGDHPMRSGQMRYECVSEQEGAGKPLKECKMVSVVLTVIDAEDTTTLAQHGSEYLRRIRIQRMADEALEQDGLLSQEDLAMLLHCDSRTIRRDIQYLRKELEIIVPTRGTRKDIGPGVTHREVAVRHWIEGKEPVEVARTIKHTLKAVERYIQQFCRVCFLHHKAFAPLQIAMTVGVSHSLVQKHLELLEKHRKSAEFKRRLDEMQIIGEAHFEATDEKKTAASPNNYMKRK